MKFRKNLPPRPFAVSAVFVFAAVRATLGADSGSTRMEEWKLAAEYKFNEAREAFSNLSELNPKDREAALGEAASLINAQPKTRRNLTAAVHTLMALEDQNSRDDIGIAATYLLGRIAAIHQQPADLETARRHFTALAELRSPHPLAQLAILNLVMLDLYAPDATDPAATRVATAESRAAYLLTPSARAQFHLVVGRACLAFDQPKSDALAHLKMALHHGIRSDRGRADTAISAALLSIDCGAKDDAIRFLRLFLKENPRDVRAWTARKELERISGEQPK
ncbi:MAG: hypothetical protein R3F07_14710 [Opitutaceae bacterium]